MPQITSSVATNGLPVHRVALTGTRATTILVGFDAGGFRVARGGSALASELTVLTSRLARIARADRNTRDFTFNTLRDGLADVARDLDGDAEAFIRAWLS